MEETWKDVIGFEGLYEISNTGRVNSIKRNTTAGGIVKLSVVDGYYCLTIWKDGKGSFKRVNRLVAESFIPNPENLEQVNHKDRDRKNNNVSNLEWTTARENNCHSAIHRKGKTSKYVGVFPRKYKDSVYWAAYCSLNGKRVGLGHHKTEEDAYKARVGFIEENNISKKYI